MHVGLCVFELTLLHCCAVQGESQGEYILILCNAIGSPVDSKVIELEPKFVALTGGLRQLLYGMFSTPSCSECSGPRLLCDWLSRLPRLPYQLLLRRHGGVQCGAC